MGRKPDAVTDRAYRAVRGLENDTYSMVRATMTQPWRYARTVVRLDDEMSNQERFDSELQKVLKPEELKTVAAMQQFATTTYAEDLIQFARWQQTGVIYTVHPDTLSALLDTDMSTPIPGEVLTRLPHPNPIVVLPEPIRWQTSDGNYETYEAFGVFGVRPPRRRSTSHHPDISHLVLHYFGRVTDASGSSLVQEFPDLTSPGSMRKVHQVVGCRAVVDVRVDAPLEVRERQAIDDMMAGGPLALVGFKDRDDAARGMALLTRTGLAILTYIASDNLDIEPRRRTPSKRVRRDHDEETPTSLYAVGYRVGAALHQAARNTSSTGTRPSGGGRTVTPHVRRAHFHTFRRGPGRTERFVKWLPPIAVNTEGKHSKATPTVHLID